MTQNITRQFVMPEHAVSSMRALGVAAVYLFGSRAYGVESPISDFDFGILMKNQKMVQEGNLKLYYQLYDVLSSLTKPATLAADVIDIVFLDNPRVPFELKLHIVRHGKIIFDDDPRCRADFEAALMLKAADFAPLKEEMSAALLTRI